MGKNKNQKSSLCHGYLFLAINLFPFWIMLMTSFKGSSEAISTTPSILPRQFTTEHFVDILIQRFSICRLF